jgi:hypothetical protein
VGCPTGGNDNKGNSGTLEWPASLKGEPQGDGSIYSSTWSEGEMTMALIKGQRCAKRDFDLTLSERRYSGSRNKFFW